MKPEVSIVIPTFCRPDRVRRALASVLNQKNVAALVEVVIMDNDPVASARATVDGLIKAGTRWPVIYGHEPNPGVANARNAALALARGKFIAFLDDDETATENWLHDLIEVQQQTDADIVFGPVQGRLEKEAPHQEYIESTFTRQGPATSGVIKVFYGCGNTLFKRAKFFRDSPVFNPATNEIGGEDCELFSRVEQDGAVFAWAADALVYEEIPPDRATLRYNLIKAFAFGQGPSQTAWQHRRLIGVAYWMAVGLAQALVFGTLSIFHWAFQSKRRAEIADRAAQGLGKVLWFRGLEPKFYGAAVL
ncbi:MAG: family 2 glycosyl transferase [Robiginitomaculum sp.]|nr:MAG: family 2 glycosyl transferase [Robiginitomaculum sp.]